MFYIKQLHNFFGYKSIGSLYMCVAVVSLHTLGSGKLYAQRTPALAISNSRVLTGSVKGNVTDRNGMPVPGVTVLNVVTKASTETDINGDFEITASTGHTIEISFTGMLSQSIVVNGLNKLEIALADDPKTGGYATLTSYPAQTKTAGGTVPLKLSAPDTDFFSGLLYYVSNKLK